MSMQIVPAERCDWPPPYKDATEKYSAQVRLTDDHRSLIGYVAGQPFPLLDPNDPTVATKIIWNNVFRPITTDDYDLRFYDCDTAMQVQGRAAETASSTYFQIGHYAGYSLVGRTEVEPLPIDPDFKHTGRYWLFALYPVLAPQDLRGVGFIRYRYAAADHGDDTWSWNKESRRRPSRQRVDPELSDRGLFVWIPIITRASTPRSRSTTTTYVGEKNMLATVHAAHSPELRCPLDGGGERVPGKLRDAAYVHCGSDAAGAATSMRIDGKTVIYIDSEVWFPPYDRYLRSAGRAVPRTHLLAGVSRSSGSRCEGRYLSVQA